MSLPSTPTPETEWSCFFDVATLEGTRHTLTIAPDAEERLKLAARLGLLSLNALTADLVIARKSGALAYHVTGTFRADIVQACVVTLEPIASTITDTLESWFADPEGTITIAKLRHARQTQKNQGETPLLEEKDDPESLVNGQIDLGELVTQFLSLALDPYPHAEGVALESLAPAVPHDKEAPDMIKNPFAALKDWKFKRSDDQKG